MMRFIFFGFSLIFHPIIIPLYSLSLYFTIENYNNQILKNNIEISILYFHLLIFVICILFPMASIYIMIRSKIITDFNISKRKERFPVLIVVLIYYSLAYIVFKDLNENLVQIIDNFLSLLFGGLILLILSLIISLKWKISLHSVGVSGMAAGFIALSTTMGFVKNYDQLILINGLLLIIMGIVSSSRLFLKAHKPLEVYAGLILGFIVEYYVVSNKLYL